MARSAFPATHPSESSAASPSRTGARNGTTPTCDQATVSTLCCATWSPRAGETAIAGPPTPPALSRAPLPAWRTCGCGAHLVAPGVTDGPLDARDMLDGIGPGRLAGMWPRPRHRLPVVPRPAAAVSMALSASFGAADAPLQWYAEVGIGGNASRDVVVESRSNDRASICDEYINPRALSVPGCTSPGRGAGDSWRAPFDPGAGFAGEAEVGIRLSARWRLAAAYAHGATDFDQTVSSTDATGADFDKIGNELAVGEETLRSTTSEGFRIVAYRDWPNRTRWTPYAGAGVAVSLARKDFSWLWARSADPADIATGLDQPNGDEIRRRLAGTVSAGRRTLRDTVRGYVLIAGVQRELSDRVSVGLKAQWSRFEAFKSDAYEGDLLRSHAPNLRLDDSEPVSAWSRTGDTGRLSALVTVRYAWP